ncbi:MAG: hypothetical protein ACLFSY_07530 [Desulfonatronovibrionaceae bacterium]
MYKWTVAVLAVFLLAGCGMWDKTRDAYYDYVYPTPEVELEMPGLGKKAEGRLARAFYPPDSQLSSLLRLLETQDSYPENREWFATTVRRYPWLNGVLATDTEGEVLARYPEEGVKRIDLAGYCPDEVSLGDWQIEARVEETPFGPEIVLARPFFKGPDWRGMLIVHFDPRIFAGLSPYSRELTLVMDGQVLWSERLQDLDGYLEQRPWDELLQKGVNGRFSPENGRLLWLARRVGSDWLVYVISEATVEE